jgi:putative sugar O-methyltransferase
LSALIEGIEGELGVSLDAPRIGAPYGTEVQGRLITPETLEHVYAALRLRRIMERQLGEPAPAIVEVGGGFGGMAGWYLRSAAELAPYTLIDLPMAAALQAYFLGMLFGPDQVQLAGERTPARIRILPPGAVETVTADVFVNENSLAEMTENAARIYLVWARDHTRLIYSYNQESRAPAEGGPQLVARELVESIGGLERVSREHSWVRRGYVEEVFVPRR